MKYVYILTRRPTNGIGDCDTLIGHYARPSAARAAATTHEASSCPELIPPWRYVRIHGGYWYRPTRLGVYLYEVRRELATPPGA